MKKLPVSILLYLAITGCQAPENNISLENKSMVAKAFEVVGAGDYDKMGDYIADDYVRHSQATPDLVVNSLTDFKEFIRQDREAVPDQQMEIKYLVAEDDLVAFYATYMGTQSGQMGPFPASNKYATLEFAGVHRIENGKIAETWITGDNIAFLSQLGHFPPPPVVASDEKDEK